jgi:hypothetical protein
MTKREFKFRVWDIKNKEYYYNFEFGDGDDGYFSFGYLSENFIVQQFTGILDKNKKEIYEGDIIRYELGGKGRNAEVWWDEEFAMFCFDRDYEFTFMDGAQNIEVLGNIYETPDLLE